MTGLRRRLAALELERAGDATLQLFDDLWDGFAAYGHPESWEWPEPWLEVPAATRTFVLEMYEYWRANPRPLTEQERQRVRRHEFSRSRSPIAR